MPDRTIPYLTYHYFHRQSGAAQRHDSRSITSDVNPALRCSSDRPTALGLSWAGMPFISTQALCPVGLTRGWHVGLRRRKTANPLPRSLTARCKLLRPSGCKRPIVIGAIAAKGAAISSSHVAHVRVLTSLARSRTRCGKGASRLRTSNALKGDYASLRPVIRVCLTKLQGSRRRSSSRAPLHPSRSSHRRMDPREQMQ